MIGPEPNGIVAVFPTRFEADSALEWLQFDGIEKRSISILGPAEARAELPPELDRSPLHRNEVASYWARWGGMLGAALGVGPAAIALAASTVGMGPFVFALATGIAFAAVTAGVGALGGALIGAGIHGRRAREYEKALADGKFLLVMRADDPASLRDAREELTRLGAESLDVHGLSPLAT